MMTPQEMIAQATADEEKYQFTKLSHDDIWDLGCELRQISKESEKPFIFEIDINGTNVFRYIPEGTAKANTVWLDRKRKTVQLMEKSSLRAHAELAAQGLSLQSKHRLDPAVYADCGGGFPIRMRNGGFVIGFIGVSGLPHYMDHAAIVQGLERFFATHPQD